MLNFPVPLIQIWASLVAQTVESACSVGDPGSIPGLGRPPGEENGNPLQYSCLENPIDGGAWQAIVPEVIKSQTHLNDFTFTHSDNLERLQARMAMKRFRPMRFNR